MFGRKRETLQTAQDFNRAVENAAHVSSKPADTQHPAVSHPEFSSLPENVIEMNQVEGALFDQAQTEQVPGESWSKAAPSFKDHKIPDMPGTHKNGQSESTEQIAGRIQEPTKKPVDAKPTIPAHQPTFTISTASSRIGRRAFERVREVLLQRIDPAAALSLSRPALLAQLQDFVSEISTEQRLQINQREQTEVAQEIMDDLIGLGPVEALLRDDSVADILINGPDKIYIEKNGRLHLSGTQFRDEGHLLAVARRIATLVGRRVDESSPMVDARLADGSRVNIIIPPLSLTGSCISIRKFRKGHISLGDMVRTGSLSHEMAQLLNIAGQCRLNILVSGGTGAGKTTLMNALSEVISHEERVVTIEDAAELKLQQPHVVPLETRTVNSENQGEVSIRDLVKNSLRMRPDRIIVGEVRGAEVVDMLQAMNTGHDGSMSTLHANSARDAFVRLENMMHMANLHIPQEALRAQIVGAVNLIVQVERMRDGVRRITSITEPAGMEGSTIISQDLFRFEHSGELVDGKLQGVFKKSTGRPSFYKRAVEFGLGDALMDVVR